VGYVRRIKTPHLTKKVFKNPLTNRPECGIIITERNEREIKKMDFWIVFGVLGLVWLMPITMFLACGVDAKHKIGGALVCLAFWMVMTVGLYCESTARADAWNGGYCECGAHWELRGTTKSRHGDVTKYYVCPDCYAEIQQ
jgi:hypothetical protein